METYISEADLIVRAKKYRDELSYDDKFDFEIETSILNFKQKGRTNFGKHLTASQARMKRYGMHKNKNKAA